MSLALVRHGDPTTTRGFVIAYSSTMHDDGKKIALFGDTATCGNCKGEYPICGTGTGMSEAGRDVVVHGDKVLCPCGKNRVIAGSDAGCFLEKEAEAFSVSSTRAPVAGENPSVSWTYDERVRALSQTRTELDGYPYCIETQDGRTYSGRLGVDGSLPRVSTVEPGEYSVYWGDNALVRWEELA